MHTNLSNEIQGYKSTPSIKISFLFTAVILGILSGYILVSHNNSQVEKLLIRTERQ